MAHTTVEKIEAIMHFDFDESTNPKASQVESQIIPMSDRKVDRLNIPNVSADDKDDLSSLWAAHLIASAKDTDFRNADISISSSRVVTNFSRLFEETVNEKGRGAFFKVANPA